MKLSNHFEDSEFACSCGCGEKFVNPRLVRLLERIRVHFRVPVKVTSARRCKVWNEAVGSDETSQHRIGFAADIQVKDVDPETVAEYVEGIPDFMGGLGRYHTFTHVDVRQSNARWDNR